MSSSHWPIYNKFPPAVTNHSSLSGISHSVQSQHSIHLRDLRGGEADREVVELDAQGQLANEK